jgi:hypothetical protein
VNGLVLILLIYLNLLIFLGTELHGRPKLPIFRDRGGYARIEDPRWPSHAGTPDHREFRHLWIYRRT